MLTNPLQRARSHAQMTGSGSGAAEFNPQHHSIRQREKSGLAAAFGPHPLAGCPGKRLDRLGGDGWPQSFYRALGPLGVSTGWPRMAFSSVMRSFSIRSERSVTPFSMVS